MIQLSSRRNQKVKPVTCALASTALVFLFATMPQSAYATPKQADDSTNYKTFEEWCTNREQLPPASKRTVELILQDISEQGDSTLNHLCCAIG